MLALFVNTTMKKRFFDIKRETVLNKTFYKVIMLCYIL